MKNKQNKMENPEIILGLSVVILVGLITVFAFRSNRKKVISEVAIDEIRRTLWEKGATTTNFQKMNIWQAFKHFGFVVIPNAAYKDNYFVEVTATDENGEEKLHLAHITLAFDKDVIKTEYKFNYR